MSMGVFIRPTVMATVVFCLMCIISIEYFRHIYTVGPANGGAENFIVTDHTPLQPLPLHHNPRLEAGLVPPRDYAPIRIYTPMAPDEVPDHLVGKTYWDLQENVDDQYQTPQRFRARLLESSYYTPDVEAADCIVIPIEFRLVHTGQWHEYDDWLKSQTFVGRKPLVFVWSHYTAFPPSEWRRRSVYAAVEFSPEQGIRTGWDFVIPMATPVTPVFLNDFLVYMNGRRTGIMYFRGAVTRARPPYLEYFHGLPGYTIETGAQNAWTTKEDYYQQILSHVFCLVGVGDSQIARRTYEAIAGGCLPVIISMDSVLEPLDSHPVLPVMILPFESLVDWESFAVVVPPLYTPEALRRMLEEMSPEEIAARQTSMERYRRAFIMEEHANPRAPDMFDYIIAELNQRLVWMRSREDW